MFSLRDSPAAKPRKKKKKTEQTKTKQKTKTIMKNNEIHHEKQKKEVKTKQKKVKTNEPTKKQKNVKAFLSDHLHVYVASAHFEALKPGFSVGVKRFLRVLVGLKKRFKKM